jgi:hypothetical protein
MIPQVWHEVATFTIRVNPRSETVKTRLLGENPDCDYVVRFLALQS